MKRQCFYRCKFQCHASLSCCAHV
ncbi:hypothetical protein [Vibrio cholerae]